MFIQCQLHGRDNNGNHLFSQNHHAMVMHDNKINPIFVHIRKRRAQAQANTHTEGEREQEREVEMEGGRERENQKGCCFTCIKHTQFIKRSLNIKTNRDKIN